MSEPLFRLLLIRAPVAQDPDAPSIKLAQNSQYQEDLAAALGGNDPQVNSINASKAFINGTNFIRDVDGTDALKSLRRFGLLATEASSGNELPLTTVLQLVEQVFGISAAELVLQSDFASLVADLRDSIVAIKFVQEDHSLPLETLVNLLRDAELIQKAANLSKAALDTKKAPVARDDPASSATGGPHSVPEWHAQTMYKIGDRVSYGRVSYVCIQAHTSLVGWEPPKVPALWVRVSDDVPPTPGQGGVDNLFAYRMRSLQLPIDENFKSIIAAPPESPPGEQPSLESVAKGLLNRHGSLRDSIIELKAIATSNILASERASHSGIGIDDEFSAPKLFGEQLHHVSQLRMLNIEQFRAAAARSGTDPATGPEITKRVASTAEPGTDPLLLQDGAGAASAVGLVRELRTPPPGLTGATKFFPSPPGEVAPRLLESTKLSANTMDVLASLNIKHHEIALPELVKTLRASLTDTEASIKALVPFERTSVSIIAGSTVVTKSPIASIISKFITGIDFDYKPVLPQLPPPDPRIPHTKGKLSKIGVGDLIIVRQQLVGYEGADIAHIENVLKGESKKRDHTSTLRTETVVSTEEETATEDSHELSSTSRFEISQEASQVIKEQSELKGSAEVTAKYGTAIEFTAKAEAGTQRSKEAATKTASQFSQDVTEKATKKITERILKKQTVTTSSEVVELNSHGIDNGSGGGNISGVYQWVNKVYEAQMFNYGLRALFDFMIPEPGAFLTDIMTKAATQAPSLVKPQPFTLEPSQITEANYGYWVKMYEATDVKPPPPDYITVSDGFSQSGLKMNDAAIHTGSISIEKNYEAIQARVGESGALWTSEQLVDVIVGNGFLRITTAGVHTLQLARQRSNIPWGVLSFRIAATSVTIEVTCVATEDAINEWKADTHGKLVTAFKARMQEYDEKLASLQLQAGITIQGRNPASNGISVRDELKKNCISVITGQHYDAFNSILTSSSYGPYINLFEAESEGEYVRFFEQAFEWENMMYIMYPYFWGRKNTWSDKLSIQDADPAFEEFLKAGFCRVQVPARPGFEAAIDHFLQFGELWNGGPLPAISSPLFLPIADEIAERAQMPGDEVPQGNSWKVKVPTSLVKLRKDDSLPRWKKDANGEWVPDES